MSQEIGTTAPRASRASIVPHLPYLRRYARALTGSQRSGDNYVRACLEAIIASEDLVDRNLPPRVALYTAFHRIWSATHIAERPTTGSTDELDILGRFDQLTPAWRQALLLTSMEDFTREEAATILDCSLEDIAEMIDRAMREITAQTAVPVLIIEDEMVIALELQKIVEEMGHFVTAVATTKGKAVAAAQQQPPGLILSDIQLADNSSGVDAINEILRGKGAAPAIFITAFPERVLTGERNEPAYLITKPFMPATVKAAIAQALFLNDAAPAQRLSA